MSIKSLEAQRELADLAGIPFSTHDAEHDDIIDTIELSSEVIQQRISDLSQSLGEVEETVGRLSKSIESVQYIVASVLVCLVFLLYRLS